MIFDFRLFSVTQGILSPTEYVLGREIRIRRTGIALLAIFTRVWDIVLSPVHRIFRAANRSVKKMKLHFVSFNCRVYLNTNKFFIRARQPQPWPRGWR